MALRATHVFRKENGVPKMVLRHAGPLMGKQTPASVMQE
jgi:hypothetical protein